MNYLCTIYNCRISLSENASSRSALYPYGIVSIATTVANFCNLAASLSQSDCALILTLATLCRH
jgi:hypothetical protein